MEVLVGNEITRLEPQSNADIIASIVTTGDLSALSSSQLVRFYNAECARLQLDPLSRPFDLLRLNSKLVLYANRRCADQLAAKHKVTRTIVEGPDVRKFGTTELLFCKVRVSTPDGRVEEDVATLPVADLVNAVMKIATKAARRATLKVCGWGELDESEIETIQGAQRVTIEQIERERTTVNALDELRDQLASAETTASLRAVYEEHRAAIAEMDVDGVALKQARDACHEHAVQHGWARTKADTDRLLGKGEPLTIDVAGIVTRYASAATTAEVDTIAAQIAGVKLAKEARTTLAAAHNEALSRIYCADASAWDARLMATDKAHEVASAFVKRADAFEAAGVVEARWERTAERLVALGVEDPAAFTDAARARRAA